ncbi:MAG: hypothetical protein AABY05_01685 [Nanoarchaeota archaeon]
MGNSGKQGIEVICYGLTPQSCQCLFESEEKARKTIGQDFSQLVIKGSSYFLSDYAVHGQQGRTLVELMYQSLYDPSVFNNPLIHSPGRLFGFVHVSNTGFGEFIARPKPKDKLELKNVPSVREMYDCLRERRFFEDLQYVQGVGIKPLIKLLNLVLEGEVEQPDETLPILINEFR